MTAKKISAKIKKPIKKAVKKIASKKPVAKSSSENKSRDAIKKLLNAIGYSENPKKSYQYPIQPPAIPPGVVPSGKKAPVMAMDSAAISYLQAYTNTGGFPGFAYLSQLSTRPEYRSFAAAISSELTRKWIEVVSKDDTDNEKIVAIEAEIKELGLRGVIQQAAEHDCYFGRGQIFIDIDGADIKKPLVLDPRTIKKGSLRRITTVEAMWTTPSMYNAQDPTAPNFYRPTSWFMLGRETHASRLMTVVTRSLPDMLKPAFNFAGISLSQLMEPYVDNWLRTRQSVSDLVNNFSITAIRTDMSQALAGDEDCSDIFSRAKLFTAMRSNNGLMLLDKDREEFQQLNTPLSGLHELQAQAQEHLCSISRIPAIILTGISPQGLNASSEGEIRAWYDWISSQQEAYWREPIETIVKVIQLSLFGEIDEDIGIKFVPLHQPNKVEEAAIRKSDADAAAIYVDRGILDPSEVRECLSSDENSGYDGIDIEDMPVPPNEPDDELTDPDEKPVEKQAA